MLVLDQLIEELGEEIRVAYDLEDGFAHPAQTTQVSTPFFTFWHIVAKKRAERDVYGREDLLRQ